MSKEVLESTVTLGESRWMMLRPKHSLIARKGQKPGCWTWRIRSFIDLSFFLSFSFFLILYLMSFPWCASCLSLSTLLRSHEEVLKSAVEKCMFWTDSEHDQLTINSPRLYCQCRQAAGSFKWSAAINFSCSDQSWAKSGFDQKYDKWWEMMRMHRNEETHRLGAVPAGMTIALHIL